VGRGGGGGGGSQNRTKRSVYSEQKSGAELFSCRTAHPPVEDNQKCLISFSAPCTRDISSRFCTYAFTSTGAKLNVPGEETPQRISECMIIIYPERTGTYATFASIEFIEGNARIISIIIRNIQSPDCICINERILKFE